MAEKNMIVVDYSDDDIAIIDNVNDLTELSPTRFRNNFISIIKHGKVQMKVNGQTVTLGENQLFFCPPNTSLTDFLFSPGLEFSAILLTDRIIASFLRDKKSIWNETMYIYKMHVVSIQERDTEFLLNLLQSLHLLTQIKEDEYPYRAESIRGLVYSYIFGLCSILSAALPKKNDVKVAQNDNIFQQFLSVLNENRIPTNRVEDYASELNISPKYLSAVCRKVSGKTAKQWIKEHTMEEIRYYLMQTDLSVKQVADKTGFINDSFFCKFVRLNFGMTPMQLRQK